MAIGSIEEVEAAVSSLVVGRDRDSVAHALGVLDRFTARVVAAVGELDAAGGWALDGAGSLPAWLRDRGRMGGAAASAMAGTARVLRSLPVTADAWHDGTLSGGQVAAVRRAVGREHVETFAAQEGELVPSLAPLTVADTETVMRAWRDMADDQTDQPDPVERPSEVYLDDLFDGATLTGHLSGHLRALVAKALQRAEIADTPGEHRRPAQRRADALGELCRSFLDHHATRTAGGRTRPHVNVVIDLDDLPDLDRQPRVDLLAPPPPHPRRQLATVLRPEDRNRDGHRPRRAHPNLQTARRHRPPRRPCATHPTRRVNGRVARRASRAGTLE